MSRDSGLEDDTLIDLFRSEVETHSESLSAALLTLERAPNDTSRIDEMMRAAHSIKGAARVVGVDPAVSVAHVMEDCFVAAQTGSLSLKSSDIDVLLRGVDLLAKISAATRDPNLDLGQEFSGRVQTLVIELQDVLTGTTKSPKPNETSVNERLDDGSTKPAPVETNIATPAISAVTIEFPEILDTSAADAIRKRILAALGGSSSQIRLDLSATKDLDVQGLSLLAALPVHLAKLGMPPLELAALSPEIATALRVTGLAEAFGVRKDLAGKAE